MKKLFAAATLTVALAAGPVAAATYPGSASFGGTIWQVSWNTTPPRCSGLDFDLGVSKVKLIVDGTPHSITSYSTDTADPAKTVIGFHGAPDGNLSSITIEGKSYFECGGDTYLLPGHVAPPAPIPTLSEWAMILLGVALAGGAALTIHRRRMA